MTARYTALDPRFTVWCVACCFGGNHQCEGTIAIPKPDIRAGNYRCACHRCKCEKKAS